MYLMICISTDIPYGVWNLLRYTESSMKSLWTAVRRVFVILLEQLVQEFCTAGLKTYVTIQSCIVIFDFFGFKIDRNIENMRENNIGVETETSSQMT